MNIFASAAHSSSWAWMSSSFSGYARPTYILLRHLSPLHQNIDQLSHRFLIKRHASLALARSTGQKVDEWRDNPVQLDRFALGRFWNRRAICEIIPHVCWIERVEVMQRGGNVSGQIWGDDAWKRRVYRVEGLSFPARSGNSRGK